MGLATLFDGIVADIQEQINLILTGFNKVLNFSNQYFHTSFSPFDTVAPGSIASAAIDAEKSRSAALFSQVEARKKQTIFSYFTKIILRLHRT